jgi:hypothetical protein
MKIPTVAVELEGNIVRIELTFRDGYEAAVYHDDVCERLQSGDGLRVVLNCPPQKGVIERPE